MSINYIDFFFDTDVSSVTLDNLSILYIENDGVLKEKVRSLLVGIFEHVDVSSNSKEGFDKFTEAYNKESAFDMVLIDLKIQDMNAFDLIKKIKTCSPDTPCILIADPNDPVLILKAINIDVTNFLIAPLFIYKLIYTLKKAYAIKYYKNLLLSE